MPITVISEADWIFVPPLDLPLILRAENGRFGAPRPKPLPAAPPCSTAQVLPGDDPRNPTGQDVYFATQLHEAVDLAATVGDCVFAAYSGRVAAVETNPAQTRGNVVLDHHPRGLGFVTKYNHVTDISVAPGDFIQKGTPFATVSAEPDEPHLHFELWVVIDRSSATTVQWPNDNDLLPLDPTRPLYAWEQRTEPDEALSGGLVVPTSIALVTLHAVPFFAAAFDLGTTTVLHVPMYEPMTQDERLAIEMLRQAHATDVGVTLRYRASAFWGVDIVTQIQIG